MRSKDKRELINYLTDVNNDLVNKFDLGICKDFRLDFFLLHIEECITDIEDEIDAEKKSLKKLWKKVDSH